MGNNERDEQEQAERARQEQEQERAVARMREQQVVGENETANNPVIINK